MKSPVILGVCVMLLTGCAPEPSKLVTSSIRTPKPAAHGVKTAEAVRTTPEEAKRAWCLQRYTQSQGGSAPGGSAPGGAKSVDEVRQQDAYCRDAMVGAR